MQRLLKPIVAALAIIVGLSYTPRLSAGEPISWEEEWMIMMGFDRPASMQSRKSLGGIGKQISAPSAKSSPSKSSKARNPSSRRGRKEARKRKRGRR